MCSKYPSTYTYLDFLRNNKILFRCQVFRKNRLALETRMWLSSDLFDFWTVMGFWQLILFGTCSFANAWKLETTLLHLQCGMVINLSDRYRTGEHIGCQVFRQTVLNIYAMQLVRATQMSKPIEPQFRTHSQTRSPKLLRATLVKFTWNLLIPFVYAGVDIYVGLHCADVDF